MTGVPAVRWSRSPATSPARPPRPEEQRAVARRATAAAARAWDRASGWVPLTPLGVLALPLLVVLARWFSGAHNDLIVRAVCLGGQLVFAVEILAVLVTAGWLALRREPSVAAGFALEVGRPCRTGYRLGAARWNPLVRVTLVWDDPPATAGWVAARGGWEEQVVPAGRGEAAEVRRCFTVTDLFGLSRVRVRRRAAGPVVARPFQGRPTLYAVRELFKAGDQLGRPDGKPDGDMVEMRRYVPGDPLKLVLWKVYARTGAMLVRTPERALDPTDRTLAFLVAAAGDEPAAGLARLALEQGLLGRDVVFSADGAPDPARTPAEGVDQIVRSVSFHATGGADLDRFLGRGKTGAAGACVLFVSHRPGPWLGRVVATLAKHPGPFRAVVGVDGVACAADHRRLGRVLFRRPAADLPRASDIRAVTTALRAAGAEVQVIDRQTGQPLAADDGGAGRGRKDAA